jgi:hypothetical protein
MPLPLYQCHKKVRAAKIICITGPEGFSDGHAEIVLDQPDPQYPTSGHVAVAVDSAWLQRNPKVAVGGYFVHYCENADNYTTYSPAEPFESGYTLIMEA